MRVSGCMQTNCQTLLGKGGRYAEMVNMIDSTKISNKNRLKKSWTNGR